MGEKKITLYIGATLGLLGGVFFGYKAVESFFQFGSFIQAGGAVVLSLICLGVFFESCSRIFDWKNDTVDLNKKQIKKEK